MQIAILTGAELRHDFVRILIAHTPGINVKRSYCEDIRLHPIIARKEGDNSQRLQHLIMRRQSESDFFSIFTTRTADQSNAVYIQNGEINDSQYVEEIESLEPDILIAYGCSIIKKPLLKKFGRKILNVHLGLSPYYRGSSTNYWPLVRGAPEYVGATFMYMDSGIDTGEIIHQIRARIFPGDSPHQIGNRLICDMALVYTEILKKHKKLTVMRQIPSSNEIEYCRRDDFSEHSVELLYDNFSTGMIDNYLDNMEKRCKNVPIVENPTVRTVETLRESKL
ncbi:MAG: hypothetical protein CMO98_05845 [Woeseia sp.]|nr:hypothetical protein [Woeseia sp.]